MKPASEWNWSRFLMLGGLVSFAAATQAEPVATKQAAVASKAKAVHYIENPPPDRQNKQQVLKSSEIKIEEIKTQPALEPPPLELKGVRG